MRRSISFIIDFMGKTYTMSPVYIDDVDRMKMLIKCNQNKGSIITEYDAHEKKRVFNGKEWLDEAN